MKHIALLITVITILSIMLFSPGCNDKPTTSGGIGFFPTIDQMQILNNNDPSNPVLAGTFKTGDNICFNMQAEDNDQNMKTLWYTVYLTATDTIFSGPEAIELSKQNQANMLYYKIGSMQLTEPAGVYSIDFEIEDEMGNRSKVYIIELTVL